MGSLSGIGIGLSFVFGCFLMGLLAELYYLLWWKKRVCSSSSSSSSSSSTATTIKAEDFSFLFCWKRQNCPFTSSNQHVRNSSEQDDLEMGSSKNNVGVEGADAELMRMHNLCGPPRFLFTIKEESKEDLESEDGKSRTNKSTLSATPFLSPLSSPSLKSSILSDPFSSHGFNPLYESFTEAEVNRLRSSPPPMFKFLKDAEDKMIRKLLMEEVERKRGLSIKNVEQESAMEDASCVVKSSDQGAAQVSSSPTFTPLVH